MADSSGEKRASTRGMGRGHREGNRPLLDDGGISISEGCRPLVRALLHVYSLLVQEGSLLLLTSFLVGPCNPTCFPNRFPATVLHRLPELLLFHPQLARALGDLVDL